MTPQTKTTLKLTDEDTRDEAIKKWHGSESPVLRQTAP